MCYMLRVTRSNYYNWCQAPISKRSKQDADLSKQITDVFNEGRQKYGTRKIKARLSQRGTVISRRRIARLMQASGLEVKQKRKYKVTTDSKHNLPISSNLLNREFNVNKENIAWTGDITYIPTKKGWLYLATVIDLYSRKIVGWSMSSNMKASLVNDAITMAIWARKPNKGIIWHTDRGSQYCSKSHRSILQDHGIQQSMSRKGDCWDNATSESFFSIIKRELVVLHDFADQNEARDAIFEYIEVFYNRVRAHSTIGYLAPAEFEAIARTA